MSTAHDPVGTLARADLLFLASRYLTSHAGPQPDPADLSLLAGRSGLARLDAGERSLLAADAAHRQADPGGLLLERNRLFDGPTVCPPNECAYIRRDKGAILADLGGFYSAFGFAVDESTGEKADHLATELQFAALLLVLLARAGDRGDRPAAETTRDALAAFAGDHLGAWLDLFCQRVECSTEHPAFLELVPLLLNAWTTVAHSHNLPSASTSNPADVDHDPGTPYECGLCPDGVTRRSSPGSTIP